MIELILSVCMVSDPGRCKDVRLSFAEQNISAQACMFNGQLEIIKWTESHPDWQVANWQCGRAGLMAKA